MEPTASDALRAAGLSVAARRLLTVFWPFFQSRFDLTTAPVLFCEFGPSCEAARSQLPISTATSGFIKQRRASYGAIRRHAAHAASCGACGVMRRMRRAIPLILHDDHRAPPLDDEFACSRHTCGLDSLIEFQARGHADHLDRGQRWFGIVHIA
jgi:hypothetical protein